MEIWTSDTAVTLEVLGPAALNLELPNPSLTQGGIVACPPLVPV